MSVSVKTVWTPDFEMDYIRFGEGKEPFVILPGMSLKPITLSAEALAELFSAYTGSYTVYVFDRIKQMPAGYSVKDMAEDTARAMMLLGLRGASFFGASQGALMTECIAAEHPELVSKMLLASAYMSHNRISRETFSRWAELARGDDIRAFNSDVNSRIYSPAYQKQYKAVFDALLDEGTPQERERFAIMAEACLNHDGHGLARKISCPVFVVGATADRVTALPGTLGLADSLHCDSYIYPGFSHAVYDEAPDFRERMLNWFQNGRF